MPNCKKCNKPIRKDLALKKPGWCGHCTRKFFGDVPSCVGGVPGLRPIDPLARREANQHQLVDVIARDKAKGRRYVA